MSSSLLSLLHAVICNSFKLLGPSLIIVWRLCIADARLTDENDQSYLWGGSPTLAKCVFYS